MIDRRMEELGQGQGLRVKKRVMDSGSQQKVWISDIMEMMGLSGMGMEWKVKRLCG